jgi:hypothetical protein
MGLLANFRPAYFQQPKRASTQGGFEKLSEAKMLCQSILQKCYAFLFYRHVRMQQCAENMCPEQIKNFKNNGLPFKSFAGQKQMPVII